MSKQMWIDAYDQLVGELMEEGYDDETAYRLAEERADDRARDNFADMIDRERMRRKDS